MRHFADLTTYVGGATGYRTILNTGNTNMSAVTNLAGTANTILVAHKGLRPSNYGGGSGKDQGYVNVVPGQTGYDHMRWADTFGGGTSAHKGYARDDEGMDENHMGGPHNSGSPVLYADGSVRTYSYGYSDPSLNDDATFQAMWAWNRSITVQPPN